MGYSDGEIASDGENDVLEPKDLFSDEASEEENDAENDDGATEEKKDAQDSKEKVEKKKKRSRVVKNPRVTLNFESLRGKNGLGALKKLFSNFKFRGNGHEKEDLTKIMGTLQQWMCYQLCPSYNFESCMLQLEVLGKKKVVQTLMKKYRLGMDDWGESEINDNVDTDKLMETSEITIPTDDFDALMNEITTDDLERELMQDVTSIRNEKMQTTPSEPVLTQEQLDRIAKNRKLAEERRLKRMSAHCEPMETNNQPEISSNQDLSVETIQLEDNS